MAQTKMRKQERPSMAVDDVDYRIADIQQWEHFFVARIEVMETGESVLVHNRYRAWFQGDPREEFGHMGDIKHSICFALQERLRRFKADIEKLADNPFAQPAPSPFIDPAPLKDNPFAQLPPVDPNNPFL